MTGIIKAEQRDAITSFFFLTWISDCNAVQLIWQFAGCCCIYCIYVDWKWNRKYSKKKKKKVLIFWQSWDLFSNSFITTGNKAAFFSTAHRTVFSRCIKMHYIVCNNLLPLCDVQLALSYGDAQGRAGPLSGAEPLPWWRRAGGIASCAALHVASRLDVPVLGNPQQG